MQSSTRCTWKLETSRPQGGLELGVGKRSYRSLTHSLKEVGTGLRRHFGSRREAVKTRRPPSCSQERPGTVPHRDH